MNIGEEMTTESINKICAELLGHEVHMSNFAMAHKHEWFCIQIDENIYFLKDGAYRIFNPKEKIEDAWVLIEFAWGKGFYVEVGQQNIKGEYQCLFEHKEIRDNYWTSVEKSAPKAISLAFIKAMK